MPVEIAIPFRLNAGGGIAVESNPNAQIRQHVMSLINTEPSERVVLGDYGVPLSDALFAEGDEIVAVELGDAIASALAKWEPGVVLMNVGAVPGPEADGLATIDVKYLRSDAPDSNVSGRNSNIAVIRVGGRVDEVIRG